MLTLQQCRPDVSCRRALWDAYHVAVQRKPTSTLTLLLQVGCFLAVPTGLALGYVLFFDAASNGASSGGTRSDGCHVRLLGEE